jgi:hypothetical protein
LRSRATSVGHQGWQQGYGAKVRNLVEDERQRRLEATAPVADGKLAGRSMMSSRSSAAMKTNVALDPMAAPKR